MLSVVMQHDIAHAIDHVIQGERVLAYTDGGLDPGLEPKAGWGCALCPNPGEAWLQSSGIGGVMPASGQQVLSLYGRLHGAQNNSYAEAMALLQVLRWVHPAVELHRPSSTRLSCQGGGAFVGVQGSFCCERYGGQSCRDRV